MNQPSLQRATAYTLLALLALGLSACAPPEPTDEAIQRAIHDMATALEARESSALLARLHDDLSAQESRQGSFGKEEARRLLMAVFYRHRDIGVVVTNIQVTPDAIRDDRASASFNALVTGGQGGLLPERAQLYRIHSEWQLDDDWQLIALEAKRALE